MVWNYKVDLAQAKRLATAYGKKNDTDVVFVFGDLSSVSHWDLRTEAIRRQHRRANVLVLLSTGGGSPHAAYGAGRFLQDTYTKVQVFVPTVCKSAGTLLAIAAHELLMTDIGELGPIDIQQTRHDQWDSISGLVENAAAKSLEDVSSRLFARLVAETRRMGRVTFKTAAEAAVPIVTGALSPIYAQIDPLRLGEAARGLEISKEYAQRLNEESQNLETNAAEKLVAEYPDHNFMIDRKEADELFKQVHAPCDALMAIRSHLGPLVHSDSGRRAFVTYLNDDDEQTNEETTDDQASHPAAVLEEDGAAAEGESAGD
ncbi:MAG: SppA protein [Gammaproteobacteria bacterium]|nr:SppA protein [Gammaproteobacteria bacterium]